jgi:hypothetical protein
MAGEVWPGKLMLGKAWFGWMWYGKEWRFLASWRQAIKNSSFLLNGGA